MDINGCGVVLCLMMWYLSRHSLPATSEHSKPTLHVARRAAFASSRLKIASSFCNSTACLIGCLGRDPAGANSGLNARGRGSGHRGGTFLVVDILSIHGHVLALPTEAGRSSRRK